MRGTSSFAASLRAFSLPGENVAVRSASVCSVATASASVDVKVMRVSTTPDGWTV